MSLLAAVAYKEQKILFKERNREKTEVNRSIFTISILYIENMPDLPVFKKEQYVL